MITTQYARNGALAAESRIFVRLVALGRSRTERRECLVVENQLGRRTIKTRRSIFEALESRFSDVSRARDLGELVDTAISSRALRLGFLSELAATDELVSRYLCFLSSHIGDQIDYADAGLFISTLVEQKLGVEAWAPSLLRRAVSSLNGIPYTFGVWLERRPERVPEVVLPIEVMAIHFWWQCRDGKHVLRAPFFRLVGMSEERAMRQLWDCARRGWFEVEALADVLNVRPVIAELAEMFGPGRSYGFGGVTR